MRAGRQTHTDAERGLQAPRDQPSRYPTTTTFLPHSQAVGKCLQGRATTLGIVKPHVVLDLAAGLMLDCVLEHFDITAAQMFKLDKNAASEFYEVDGRGSAGVWNVWNVGGKCGGRVGLGLYEGGRAWGASVPGSG